MSNPLGILVLGASSDMARACTLALAREYKRSKFYLAGRDVAALERQATDLSIRIGCTVSAHHFDALDTLVADSFEQRGCGKLIVVSSVAGDRGRASNYVYGSAKAGLSAFLSGLRQRLHNHGVQVTTVLPGFVKTRMVEGMELPEALTASPEQVAADVLKAVQKGKGVVYTRFFWRYIMLIVTHIPEFMFRKMERF